MSIAGTPNKCFMGSVFFLAVVMFMPLKPGMTQELPQFETTLKQMLSAVQTNSYDQFVAQGDPAFKASFTKQMVEELSQRLGPRLRQGYSATFLAKLNQQGYVVFVWKLEFKDGEDDYLVSMFVKNGKVSGLVTR